MKTRPQSWLRHYVNRERLHTLEVHKDNRLQVLDSLTLFTKVKTIATPIIKLSEYAHFPKVETIGYSIFTR